MTWRRHCRRHGARGAATLLLLLALALWGPAALAQTEAPSVPSVYLVQNSGWMEPFFTDRAAGLRDRLTRLVAATETGETIVATFNQEGDLPGRPSPDPIYAGPYDAAAIARALADLSDPPRKPNGAFADADLNEALVNGLSRLLAGRAGIVWMVTNNKNAPDTGRDDAGVVENTRAFARALSTEPNLPRIIAFPVPIPAQGARFSGSGLFVYGIAYGEEGAEALQAVAERPDLAALFDAPPAVLKPLGQAPLAFEPVSAEGAASVALDPATGGLFVGGIAAGSGAVVTVTGTIGSDYYPHVIERARLSVAWAALDEGIDAAALPATLTPDRLSGLAPFGRTDPVRLTLTVPPVERPGEAWQEARARVSGLLRLYLTEMDLDLAPAFAARATAVAAGDQLPGIFYDYRDVAQATVDVPVTLELVFPATPIWPWVLAGVGAVVALLAAGALLLRERQFRVPVDGTTRLVHLRPFTSQEFARLDGGRVRVTGTPFGPPHIRPLPPRP